MMNEGTKEPDDEQGNVFSFLAALESAFTLLCPRWVLNLQKKGRKEEQKDQGEENKSAGQ